MNRKRKLINIIPITLSSLFITSCFLWSESSEETTEYTVTFYNGDNKIEENKVKEGNKPTYNSTTPYKDSALDIYYTFAGWSKSKDASASSAITTNNLPSVTENITYYAIFKVSGAELNIKAKERLKSNLEKIELDYRGKSESAYSNTKEITLYGEEKDFEGITSEWTFDDENDENYFSIEKSNEYKATITATNPSRWTNLNITLKLNDEVVSTETIPLFSFTTNFVEDEIEFANKYANHNIENTSYLTGLYLESEEEFTLDRSTEENAKGVQDDLVIPSKYKVNGKIKEVASFKTKGNINNSNTNMIARYVRKCYIPNTIFNFEEGALAGYFINNYLKFEKSKYDFILFNPGSMINNGGNSYFLYEKTGGLGNIYTIQSRFFAGTDYYSFPYNYYDFQSELEDWTPDLKSWDWQEDYVEKYSGIYSTDIRTNIQKNYVLFEQVD